MRAEFWYVPLPERTAEIQAAINAAGLANVTVTASAYGENCYSANPDDVGIGPMQTESYFVTALVDDLTDEATLGDLAAEILAVLNQFPPREGFRPIPDQFIITFIQNEQQLTLRVGVAQAAQVIEQGLSGEALWNALIA
jgi:hypothetical protein